MVSDFSLFPFRFILGENPAVFPIGGNRICGSEILKLSRLAIIFFSLSNEGSYRKEVTVDLVRDMITIYHAGSRAILTLFVRAACVSF